MTKTTKTNNKPLTLDEMAKYNRESLLLMMSETLLEIFFAILQRNGLMVPDDIKKLTKQDILTVVHAK